MKREPTLIRRTCNAAATFMFACAVAVLGVASSFAQNGPASSGLNADEAAKIATDAYIYGYPLVTMEYTRRALTNVAKPNATRAPMGELAKGRAYPNASFRAVTAPNADTLYTTAWVDLAKEPYVLSIPDAHGRYYLFPMLDAWTTVFQVPGTRTTGTGPQTYVITGPNWTGALPAGATQYKSPTDLVWILGRIYCTGTPADYKAVHELQDKITLVPLSSYNKAYTPPPGTVDPSIDMKTAGTRPGECTRCRGVLQPDGAVDEGQPAGGRGRADGGADGEDRNRSRTTV